MTKLIRKTNPLFKMINSALVDLPSPSNISLMWNFGSMLGICLIIQIASGLFLAIHYTADTSLSFMIISHMNRDVFYGWLMRYIHANGASLFFICLYFHIGRALNYGSFSLLDTWMSGVSLFLLTMITAFLGYVLPWGQMSFWGATVITNLLSMIPYMGTLMVQWIWGGFAVSNPTLTRFFTFHFLLPFIISALVMVHLLFLHQTGSNNPLGVKMNMDKIPFHPYFSIKDSMSLLIVLIPLSYIVMITPNMLTDPENFLPANPLVTPIHIQPEWYFLFAYAILRSIPNKLGGVIALMMSVLMLYFLPFMEKKQLKSAQFNPGYKMIIWSLMIVFILLTWIGARPVEDPFILIGQALTILYFSLFMMISLCK